MAELAVFCVEAIDGIAVDPCGTYQGVPLAPLVAPVAGAGPLDVEAAVQVLSWAMMLPLAAYFVGVIVGGIFSLMNSIR